MSSIEVQQQRKAEAIRDAAELIRRSKPDTEHLSAAMAEPVLPDVDKLAAIASELAEMVVRQERAVDHLEGQVLAAQEKEIEALHKRVEDLEKSGAPAAEPGSGATKDS